MFSPLRHPGYRHLFIAQVSALLGTGMATVALGLLAYDLAGANAGEILGAALAIKMIAYIGVAPFASALSARLPRKVLLVSLDVVRAGVAAVLPFVGEAWQVYALMTVLYVASAAFTPAFQAMIPDLLPDEGEYTKALSLSRLAADLESVASPVLAALLLAVMSYSNLFAGTAVGFVVSGLFVISAVLPKPSRAALKPFLQRLTGGMRLFALTPRLRGLLAISLATAAGGAMVFVNTVVLVQSRFGLSGQATAWALAAFGGGSMTAAVFLPRLLGRLTDRSAMVLGAATMTGVLLAGTWLAVSYVALLALWVIMGFGYSLTITPAGRALRRSSNAGDRPALFAAQFALSHACWLIAYPVAGLVSAAVDPGAAFLVLAGLCATGTVLGLLIWPAHDPENLPHNHGDLPADDPHRGEGRGGDEADHAHPFVIDERHDRWPTTKK
ncbi:MAG: MFS transporter [Brevundimonas subvibrioides]|uniref:MFS transporter n=1 Tax=Brevundimonas subvibrioides TaxID=74313 RepID=A0A258HPG1_9CAUL|nr:MFS transporter [Brevundimonas subvibrioides]OYX58679.1 MAG: MFS transporter [Brevundimonas subvibrioides]